MTPGIGGAGYDRRAYLGEQGVHRRLRGATVAITDSGGYVVMGPRRYLCRLV